MLPPSREITHLPGANARKAPSWDPHDRLRDFLAGREAEPEPDAEPTDPEPPLPE